MGRADDYVTLDATALADLVRHRHVSPAELVEAAIARLERVEPKLAGMAEWTLDQARRAAREPLADAPFAGVPFLLKDNMHVAAGIPYHNGSRIWRGWVPPQDSEMVRRFKAAGLIILGSTKVPELSLTPVTEPRHFGRANNPWALERTTGGSSGGSAAHVAARSVPMAHATDGGGSIRIPASCCGLFGLKPTRGRTPNGPYIGEGWHGAAIGHGVTRSVRDSARLLDAIAGPDPGAPYGIAPPEGSFAAAVERPCGRLRIAFSAVAPNGAVVDLQCRTAVEDAARLCAELGHCGGGRACRAGGLLQLVSDHVSGGCCARVRLCGGDDRHQGPAQRCRGEHVVVPRVGAGLLGGGTLRHAGAPAPGHAPDCRVLRDLRPVVDAGTGRPSSPARRPAAERP